MSKYYLSNQDSGFELKPRLPVMINTSTDIDAVRGAAQRAVRVNPSQYGDFENSLIEEALLRVRSEAKFKLPVEITAEKFRIYLDQVAGLLMNFLSMEARYLACQSETVLITEAKANASGMSALAPTLVVVRRNIETLIQHFPIPAGVVEHLRWVLTPHPLAPIDGSILAFIQANSTERTNFSNTSDIGDYDAELKQANYLEALSSNDNIIIAQVLTRTGIWTPPNTSPLAISAYDPEWIDVWSNLGADNVAGTDNDQPMVADHDTPIQYLAIGSSITARQLMAFPVYIGGTVGGKWENKIFEPLTDGLGSLLQDGSYEDHDDVDELNIYSAYGVMDQDTSSDLPNTTTNRNLVTFTMEELERAVYLMRKSALA